MVILSPSPAASQSDFTLIAVGQRVACAGLQRSQPACLGEKVRAFRDRREASPEIQSGAASQALHEMADGFSAPLGAEPVTVDAVSISRSITHSPSAFFRKPSAV
ncbi:MAG: hypothetical protein F6K00_32080 [Leptolyngbya sp. SIOISBB]|nr:hypothetical protein [Leptolyngbya sp. SIOISBB]